MTTCDERLVELREYVAATRTVIAADIAMSWCDSPIEQIFVLEFLAQNAEIMARDNVEHAAMARPWIESARGLILDINKGDIVAVQAEIRLPWPDERTIRVDFAIASRENGRVVVECDGHDYHERTKEQAARDRSRDRALTGLGWRVLRFTGREIVRDETGNILQDIWDVQGRISIERTGHR